MNKDLNELTEEERRQINALDVFVRTVVKRRTINHVNSYLRENRIWKQMERLEEKSASYRMKELSPLEEALKKKGIVRVSSNISAYVEDKKLAAALAGINPKYLQCLISSILLGKDDEEIARDMKLSVNTVRLYRGRGAALARKNGGYVNGEE